MDSCECGNEPPSSIKCGKGLISTPVFWIFLGQHRMSSSRVQICSITSHIFIVTHAVTIAVVQQCNYTQISKALTVNVTFSRRAV